MGDRNRGRHRCGGAAHHRSEVGGPGADLHPRVELRRLLRPHECHPPSRSLSLRRQRGGRDGHPADVHLERLLLRRAGPRSLRRDRRGSGGGLRTPEVAVSRLSRGRDPGARLAGPRNRGPTGRRRARPAHEDHARAPWQPRRVGAHARSGSRTRRHYGRGGPLRACGGVPRHAPEPRGHAGRAGAPATWLSPVPSTFRPSW